MITKKEIIICWLAFIGSVVLACWQPGNSKPEISEYLIMGITFLAAVLLTFGPYLIARNVNISPSLESDLGHLTREEQLKFLQDKGINIKDAESMLHLYNEHKRIKMHNKAIEPDRE